MFYFSNKSFTKRSYLSVAHVANQSQALSSSDGRKASIVLIGEKNHNKCFASEWKQIGF